jgi:hypothetical protein
MFPSFEIVSRRALDCICHQQHSQLQSFFQRTLQLTSRRRGLFLHHSTRERKRRGGVDLGRVAENSRQQRRSAREIQKGRILERFPRNGEARDNRRIEQAIPDGARAPHEEIKFSEEMKEIQCVTDMLR